MKIIISVETHIYVGNKLQDSILNERLGDDIDSCGIIGPEIILPLRKNKNTNIVFEYTDRTILKDVVDAIYNVFGLLSLDEMLLPKVAFMCGEIRYWIDNINANFQKNIDKHLDPQRTGRIYSALYVSGNAGCICEDEGIRYYMNSRERGKHNEPHIHLRSLGSCEEAVIIIKTGKIIGEFPRKLIKKARNKVKAEEKFFLEQWNVLTDGLKVDINRYFGLINY